MAPVFLDWLKPSPDLNWLDLGCGTGALSETILAHGRPARLICTDPSQDFLQQTQERLAGKADFAVGNAGAIPVDSNTVDVLVSGLALNFFPDLPAALAEMKRVVKPGGTIAAYVWDYAGRMDFLRIFWDIACELHPEACHLDEGIRFPICHADRLEGAFREAGLTEISTAHLDVNTVFENFEDYWNPFLSKQGPAPGFVATLSDHQKEALREALYTKLHSRKDARISLLARAIAVKGINN